MDARIEKGLSLLIKRRQGIKHYEPRTHEMRNRDVEMAILDKLGSNITFDDVLGLLTKGSCLFVRPDKSNHRCQLCRADCSYCMTTYIDGNDLGVDLLGVEKYHKGE